MARTDIEIDETACAAVIERYRLRFRKEAGNLALRRPAAKPLELYGARRMRGSGWDGDLDEMRRARSA